MHVRATGSLLNDLLVQALNEKATMSEVKASLCIVAAAVLWGHLPLFIKYFTAAGFTPEQTVFTRVLFSAVSLAAWCLFRSPADLRIRIADAWCFAGMALILGATVLLNAPRPAHPGFPGQR
jgi:drug/metabolite transporter (DMT)-like permease